MKWVVRALALALLAATAGYLIFTRSSKASDPPAQCCAQAVAMAAWAAWNELDCDGTNEAGIPCQDAMEFVQDGPLIHSVTRIAPDRVRVTLTIRSTNDTVYDLTVVTTVEGQVISATS